MANNTVKNTSKNKKSSNTAGWFLIGTPIVLIMGILALAFEGMRDKYLLPYVLIVFSPIWLPFLIGFLYRVRPVRKKVVSIKASNHNATGTFDKDIESRGPGWYDDSYDEMWFEEDYCMAKTTDEERRKMVTDYVKYWNGFEKLLHSNGITCFDESIKSIKERDYHNFEYPSIRATIKGDGKDSGDVEIKLSSYDRLFAAITIKKRPRNMSIYYLSRHIEVWRYSTDKKLHKGYGKNLHVSWSHDDNELMLLCTSHRDHESGGIANIDDEYKWLMRATKLAIAIANGKINDFDTYSPTEYKKYLKNLKLEGKTITGVMNNNSIIEYYKDCRSIEMDGNFTLSLDDGRIIGFGFGSASHPSINTFDEWDVLEKDSAIAPQTGLKNSEIFKQIVGMKITEVIVETSTNLKDIGLAYWDDDFDDKQGDFIIMLRLVLDDKLVLEIEPGEDWTDVSLNPYE